MSVAPGELRRRFGGKAAALIELRDAGFPIPDFVVSPENLCAAASRLGFPLAVRSSATLEDGGETSFAGQFQSFLNVNSIAALEEAVARCRQSVSETAVAAYCERSHCDASRLRMEFIVQRQIAPELAGVAFTINPVTGRDEVVIEATAGLADALLGGQAQPLADDHPLLIKHRRRIESVARAIQRHYGAPQDVEFAVADGTVWILQSRPVTRIAFTGEPGEWTNADFRDGGVSSGVCSPLMWSLYELVWDRSLKSSLREVGLFDGDFEAGRMFYGRPYWNLAAVKHCVRRIPGYVEREFDLDLSIEPRYEGDGETTPATLGRILRILPTVWRIGSFLRRQEREAAGLLRSGFGPFARRHDPAAEEVERDFRGFIEGDYFRLESAYFRTIFALSLAKLDFRMAFPEADYAQLTRSLPMLSHMAPVHRLREMAGDGVIDAARLAREFPHYARGGLDIRYPRWDEDLAFVEVLARQVLDPAVDPLAAPLPERCRDSLPTNRAFRRKLDRLRRFLWLREELRDLSSRMYHLIRRHVLEIAHRRGLGDDVFFMTYSDIADDDRSQIGERRDTFERFRSFAAPNEIGRRYQHDSAPSDGALRGIGASSGRVSAVAFVASNIDDALRAPRGAALVCPFTEPSWTPILDRVSAVVTETGGLLSHAAVICREYGVPAVLGIRQATRRIPSERMICVDGSRGCVELC